MQFTTDPPAQHRPLISTGSAAIPLRKFPILGHVNLTKNTVNLASGPSDKTHIAKPSERPAASSNKADPVNTRAISPNKSESGSESDLEAREGEEQQAEPPSTPVRPALTGRYRRMKPEEEQPSSGVFQSLSNFVSANNTCSNCPHQSL